MKNQYQIKLRLRNQQNQLQEKTLQVKSDSVENVLREIAGQFTNVEKCGIISPEMEIFTAQHGNIDTNQFS
mgnify:CR=1 FL=1